METQCTNISKSLKESVRNLYYSNEIQGRLKSIQGMIVRMAQTHLQSIWIKKLLDSLEKFIKNLANSNSSNIKVYLEEIENEILSCLVVDLNIPSAFYQSIMKELASPDGSSLKLSKLFPKFISNYLRKKLIQQSVARGDFEHDAKSLFDSFQIPYNYYVSSLANKYFGNEYTYNLHYLENFMELFFGSYKNYKFYVKIAKCLEQLTFKFPSEQLFPVNYDITLTVPNKAYTGNKPTLVQDQKFCVTPPGLQSENYRRDQLVIFGRHKAADIQFPPDDSSIDYAAFILINTDTNVFAMDISKKQNCGIKIDNNVPFSLGKEMLINLAKTQTFHIEDIRFEIAAPISGESETTLFFNDDEGQMHSFITLECIEGIYKGNKFQMTTKTRDPNTRKLNHMFGCGGGGEAPDMFIPKESGVSRKHIELIFNENDQSWEVVDFRSTTGTYIYLKNNLQFKNRDYSRAFPIFKEVAQYSNRTILVGKYVFFIMIT